MALRSVNEALHRVGCPPDGELRKEKLELLVVGTADLRAHGFRKVPQPALEGSERLLPGLVEELLIGILRLSLLGRGGSQPLVDLILEILREVVVEHVLEV